MKSDAVSRPVGFKPPEVNLGDTVLWKHSHDDGEYAAAIVTKVGLGGSALGMLMFPPDSRVGVVKDGVLHTDDPRNKHREGDSGVWELTPVAKRLAKVFAEFEPNDDGK